MKEVLNFGAGVQSTTLLVMSCVGRLPRLNHVIFADTQWEPVAVYRHLEWCKEFALQHGISIDVRTAGNLRDDLVAFWGPNRVSADGKRHASIPAFVKNPDGSRGLVRRQCTGTYKIDVIDRYVREVVLGLKFRQRWPLDLSVRQWIGISRDEMGRMKTSQRPAVAYWHPLIEADELQRVRPGRMFEDGFSRTDCLEWLSENGFPRPPRSACIGCPFRRKEEWQALTREEFADAVEVDGLIRAGNRERHLDGESHGEPYLHGSLLPLGEVDFGRDDGGEYSMNDECHGVCGV